MDDNLEDPFHYQEDYEERTFLEDFSTEWARNVEGTTEVQDTQEDVPHNQPLRKIGNLEKIIRRTRLLRLLIVGMVEICWKLRELSTLDNKLDRE